MSRTLRGFKMLMAGSDNLYAPEMHQKIRRRPLRINA